MFQWNEDDSIEYIDCLNGFYEEFDIRVDALSSILSYRLYSTVYRVYSVLDY